MNEILPVRLYPANAAERWQPDPKKVPIAVLMSGGVDSSVSAWLLQQQGWDVVGITMRIPVVHDCQAATGCCGTDAARVCAELGIPHFLADVAQAFHQHVIEPFLNDYISGRTPSPCISCNAELKFRQVWEAARRTLGIRHLATGHYARILQRDGKAYLVRGSDRSRDQSYFLYDLEGACLPDLHFPIADHRKERVRELAAQAGLSISAKPDSMEICFAGEGDYRALLEKLPSTEGTIIDTSGKIVGRHKGISHFTVGQRRGLRVAGKEPLFVIRLLPETQTVVIGSRQEAEKNEVQADFLRVLAPESLKTGHPLWGKVRSPGDPKACRVIALSETTVTVRFDQPVFAPAPGQHLVLYDQWKGEEFVVAGGKIVS